MGDRSGLAERIIPESRYAVFMYPGAMGAIFHTVFKDLDRWWVNHFCTRALTRLHPPRISPLWAYVSTRT